MDGVTFIERARHLGLPFRVAIMTAFDSGREVATSMGAEFLRKPIDVPRLLQLVAEVLEPAPLARPA